MTYSYDAIGQRIAKAVDSDGAGSAVAKTLRFVYDRDNVLLEFEEDATVPSQRYIHGPQVDQLLAQENDTETSLWHLSDHLGTTKDFITNAGFVQNHRTFDSYGNLVEQSGTNFSSRYGFTGREFDQETGLNYHRARYYNSIAGRFVKQDPISFSAQDTNLYRYVKNSPVDRTDPSGLYGNISIHNRIVRYQDNRGSHVVQGTNQVIRDIAEKRYGRVNIEEDTTIAMITNVGRRQGTDTSSSQRKFVPGITPIDDQGHIVSAQLGGSGTDLKNLFAQNFRYNQGRIGTRVWREFESSTADYLDRNVPELSCYSDDYVNYNVFLSYDNYKTRPRAVFGLAIFTDGKVIQTAGSQSGWVPNPIL